MSQNHAKPQSAIAFGRRRAVPVQGSAAAASLVGRASRSGRKATLVGDPMGRDAKAAGTGNGAGARINWFDYAKGICIILVVMMHSTLGVGKAFGGEGFMHLIVAYAQPFRMPDFFMLSGLFLSLAISRNWMHYLDKKLVHFAYFYVLWTVIQAIIKTGATGGLDVASLSAQFLDALVNPFPTLWFIYVLPLFFIATKLLRHVPAWLMLAGAALLQSLSIQTGWSAVDHYFVHYYVFFLGGYLLAPHVFALAQWAGDNLGKAAMAVGAWFVLNGILAFTPSPIAGWDTVASLPLVSIALGGAGATAIVVIASILQKFDVARFIRFCGANSIVLYISFTIPMALTRVILLKTHLITDVGLASFVVWMVALVSPLILYLLLRKSPLRFLYERPQWIALPYGQSGAAGANLVQERIARAAAASA